MEDEQKLTSVMGMIEGFDNGVWIYIICEDLDENLWITMEFGIDTIGM